MLDMRISLDCCHLVMCPVAPRLLAASFCLAAWAASAASAASAAASQAEAPPFWPEWDRMLCSIETPGMLKYLTGNTM